MHSINENQEPQKMNEICWFCKSSIEGPLDDYHSKPMLEDDLLNSVDFKKIFKQELLYFCRNTTIRGVPRIVKTTNKATKILWISFFIFLCGSLILCLTFLIRQFVEYNVIHPPRVLRNRMSPFPSFTLCNHRPLNYNVNSFLAERKMKNPREYAVSANTFAKRYLFEQNDTASYALLTPSFALSGYLESIPLKYHKLLGHDMKDFIIECFVLFQNGSKHSAGACIEYGNWTDMPHAQFINCFTFNLDNRLIELISTVELYIYLNEQTNNSRCLDCFLNNIKSQLSGALLVIHKNKSFPNINQEAINLQPGTLTEVRLKTFYNVMKVPPYGRCNYNTPEIVKMGIDTYSYTEHICKEKTIQTEINKNCYCNAIEYPMINRNLSFCGAIPSFVNHGSCGLNSSEQEKQKCLNEIKKAIERLQCKSKVTVLYHKDIIETCYLPCSYYTYETDRSISTWPTKSWQLTWLNSARGSYIRNKEELKDYAIANKLFSQGKEDESIKLLNTLDTLEKKLIAVIINRPNYDVHKVEEKEVLSLTSFLSQMGGLFSIFIGLSLISFVEFTELVMKIFEKVNLERSKIKSLSIKTTNKKEIVDHSFNNFLDYTSVTNL